VLRRHTPPDAMARQLTTPAQRPLLHVPVLPAMLRVPMDVSQQHSPPG